MKQPNYKRITTEAGISVGNLPTLTGHILPVEAAFIDRACAIMTRRLGLERPMSRATFAEVWALFGASQVLGQEAPGAAAIDQLVRTRELLQQPLPASLKGFKMKPPPKGSGEFESDGAIRAAKKPSIAPKKRSK